MKHTIITITEEMFDQLEKLADQLWHESYGELLSAGQITYMLQQFQCRKAFERQSREGYIYRGLVIEGNLVGYTGSQKQDDRIFLSKLYLSKKYHGLGLGKALLEDCISLYPECKAIYLTVNKYNPSYQKYRHLGFEVIDSVVTDIGEGYVMDDYIMQRKLLNKVK